MSSLLISIGNPSGLGISKSHATLGVDVQSSSTAPIYKGVRVDVSADNGSSFGDLSLSQLISLVLPFQEIDGQNVAIGEKTKTSFVISFISVPSDSYADGGISHSDSNSKSKPSILGSSNEVVGEI